jgi:hypothetical protein
METQEARQTQETQAAHIACVRRQITDMQGLLAESLCQSIISKTLPTGPGQRHRKLFDLARALKAVVPSASRDQLRIIVERWYREALPFIRTKDFTTTWAEFTIAWAAVRVPIGAVMGEVIAAAEARPIPTVGLDYDLPAMQRLVALCAQLQAHHGPGKAGPLSCRMAGNVVGVGHDTAARWLKLLVADGVLELVTPGGSKASKRAAEYRYLQCF